MQFTSFAFMLFFPLVAVLYFVLPRVARMPWLLLASLGFYCWYRPKYAVFLVFAVLSAYAAALLVQKAAGAGVKKLWLALAVLANLGVLFLLKYYGFTAGILAGAGVRLPVLELALPIGISFYTFQSIGYVVDVYRGTVAAERNLLRYALFVAFFPQILAGPIGRAPRLLPQLASPPPFAYTTAKNGLLKIGWGFFLKLVLADRLAVIAGACFATPEQYGGVVLAVGVVFYAVQIYCDFSSYSLIAIGAAGVLGVELDQNFRLPYFSLSVADFWRRWHITLGSWFRDYLFYPLLRSKALRGLQKRTGKLLGKKKARAVPTVLALLVVWAATGLWHGANFTYLAWGLYHGVLLVLGFLLTAPAQRLAKRLRLPVESKGYKLFQLLRTFALVCLGYILFAADSLTDAWVYIREMFTVWNPWTLFDGTLHTLGLAPADFTVALLAMALLLAVDLLRRKHNLLAWLARQEIWIRWGLYLVGILAVAVFGYYGPEYDAAPFIYFQF